MTVADDGPRPDRVEAGEVILDIGAEGGSLTIEGVKAAHGWRFRMVKDDASYALLDEDDRPAEYRREDWVKSSDWVESLEAALALLGQYRGTGFIRCRCIPISRRGFGRRCRNDTTRTGVGILTALREAATAGAGCATGRQTDRPERTCRRDWKVRSALLL
jgi:hypothetical protein